MFAKAVEPQMIMDGFKDDEIQLPPIVTFSKSKVGGYEGSDLFDETYAKSTEEKLALANHRNRKGSKMKKLKKDSESDVILYPSNKYVTLITGMTEMITYVAYVVVVTTLVLTFSTGSMFDISKIVQDVFVTSSTDDGPAFIDLANPGEVWDFFENQFLNGIYRNESVENHIDTNNTIYLENKIMGNPRLRMLKVHNRSCEIIEGLDEDVDECYGAYSKSREDKTSFGPQNLFIYTEAEDLEAGEFNTEFATYSGGGFTQEVDINNREIAYDVIQTMKESGWIDRGTRVIFIDFIVYNTNLNLYFNVKLYFEFPATGGVYTSSYIRAMKLFRYINSSDYFVLVFEAIFCAFTIFYFIKFCIEVFQQRLSYFKKFWHYLEMIEIGVSIAYIAISLKLMLLVNNRKIDLLQINREHYYEMHELLEVSILRGTLLAFISLTCWPRLLKYLNFVRSFNIMVDTFSRASEDLIAFSIMLSLFFLAFSQFGYLLFGTQVFDYSRFDDAFISLLRLLLGDFDYHALQKSNRILGPIYFLAYVFLIFFILLNMFLAILNDSYAAIRNGNYQKTEKHFLADYISNYAYRFFRMLKLAEDKSNKTKLTVNYFAWKNKLHKFGFSGYQINQIFAKYDIQRGEFVNRIMKNMIQKDLAQSNFNPVFIRDSRSKMPSSHLATLKDSAVTLNETLTMMTMKFHQVEVNNTIKKVDDFLGDKDDCKNTV